MTKVAIIAGSKSDEKAVKPIEAILGEAKVSYETVYLSAHRDKEKLSDYVKKSDANYFIALAGLAAALPGSIAADTSKPVIAVPVWGGSSSSPGGLDALFAAVQMPPPKDGKNVALGCVRIDGSEYAAQFVLNCINMNQNTEFDIGFVNVNEGYIQKVNDLSAMLAQYDIKSRVLDKENQTADEAKKNKINILLTNDPLRKIDVLRYTEQPLIVVPLLEPEEANIFGSGQYFGYPSFNDMHRLWHIICKVMLNEPAVSVGFNRIDNAAYFAKKLLRK